MSWPLLLGWLALLVLLVAPALANRAPILYPDSIGYSHSGKAVLQSAHGFLGVLFETAEAHPIDATSPLQRRAEDGIGLSRSPYYGTAFVLLFSIGSAWLIVVAQAATTLAALWLALPHLGASGIAARLWIITILASVSGVAAFTSTLMPDIFGGLTILAVAVMLASEKLERDERICWIIIVLAGCLFHKSFLAITAAILAATLLLHRGRVHRVSKAWGLLIGVTILACAAHFAVREVVVRVTDRPVADVPFILARLVGDGTAERYLREECPKRLFHLCSSLDRMPMTENEFLWSRDAGKGVFAVASLEEKEQILDEAPTIVAATLRHYPVEQAIASISNTARQLVTVGIREYSAEFEFTPEHTPQMASFIRSYRESGIARGTFPAAALSNVMTVSYLVSLVIALFVASGAASHVPYRAVMVTRYAVLGVIINAAVNGTFGGVFDRYQGRVAWIIVAIALAWGYSRFATRWPTAVLPATAGTSNTPPPQRH